MNPFIFASGALAGAGVVILLVMGLGIASWKAIKSKLADDAADVKAHVTSELERVLGIAPKPAPPLGAAPPAISPSIPLSVAGQKAP